MPPEPGLTELIFGEHVSGRAQRSVGEQHARRQPLEEQRVVARDREMVQRALRVAERERERARRGARVAVLLRERLRGVAIGGDAGREREPDGRAGRDPDPLAQTEDRIEHDAGRARERAAVERRRHARIAAAAEKLRAVGLPLDRRPASGLRDSARARPRRAHPPGRAAGGGRAARSWPARTPFRETVCRTPDAPGRPPAARARSRRSSSRRFRACASPWFVIVSRRTSTSSSVETAMSSWLTMVRRGAGSSRDRDET